MADDKMKAWHKETDGGLRRLVWRTQPGALFAESSV